MRVLAIDPGYEKMGVAVLEKTSGREILIFSECFKTSRTVSHAKRLSGISGEITRLLERYRPEFLSVEKLFFAKNQKTALQVAEARGVVLAEAAKTGLTVKEFTPMEAKIAVTGYGRGNKNQIKYMVEKMIAINKKIKEDDEYDAIALGLTFLASYRGSE
ncbi:crossover junction endodeoxyribonuclease RuvC [Patescibacteria group bacterium]|nr:crossover junction endodeoxyribonuclease RuvC [Patescibacteria group bacterium]